MFNHVDYIGVEAVSNLMKQTDLKRFIIFRQGAQKGSTPVFDCSYTTNNAAACKSFKDWATNIIHFNPNNFLCYDILLFNDFEDGMDEQNRNHGEEKTTGRKKGKIRFSFCLNATGVNNQQHQMGSNNVNIEEAIQRGIQQAMQAKELEDLKKRIKELEEEDDEEEEEERPDVIGSLLKTWMIQKGMENGSADTINGDELEGMTDDKTKKKNMHGFSDDQVREKMASVNKSLRTLWSVNAKLDDDLARLAKLAKDDKEVFNLLINKLRAF